VCVFSCLSFWVMVLRVVGTNHQELFAKIGWFWNEEWFQIPKKRDFNTPKIFFCKLCCQKTHYKIWLFINYALIIWFNWLHITSTPYNQDLFKNDLACDARCSWIVFACSAYSFVCGAHKSCLQLKLTPPHLTISFVSMFFRF